MRILVDMDGVLADWEASLLAGFRQRHPDRPFVAIEDRATFYAVEQYGEAEKQLVREVYLSAGFYRDLPVIAGGREALEAMRASGAEVFLCTSPLTEYRHCVLEKYEWVERCLGFDWTRVMIVAHDKTLVRGDILIDDRPSVDGLERPAWEHVLYDQPYNRTVQGRRRLTWKTWQSVLGM